MIVASAGMIYVEEEEGMQRCLDVWLWMEYSAADRSHSFNLIRALLREKISVYQTPALATLA